MLSVTLRRYHKISGICETCVIRGASEIVAAEFEKLEKTDGNKERFTAWELVNIKVF